jgi:hypothetical protein
LLVEAFVIHRPILISILGVIFVLIYLGQRNLMYPMVYILLGILFNLYGRFATKTVFYVSWSYIILGLAYVALTSLNFQYLWVIFTTYMGLTYILMGIDLKNRSEAET